MSFKLLMKTDDVIMYLNRLHPNAPVVACNVVNMWDLETY